MPQTKKQISNTTAVKQLPPIARTKPRRRGSKKPLSPADPKPILNRPTEANVLWRVDPELLAPTDEDPVDQPRTRMESFRAKGKHLLSSAKKSKPGQLLESGANAVDRKKNELYYRITGRPNKLNDREGTETQLGDREKRQLQKLPTEPFHQVVEKVSQTPLTTQAVNGERKRNENKDGKSVWTVVKSSIIDMISDILSAAKIDGVMELLKTGTDVVEQFAKDCKKVMDYLDKKKAGEEGGLGIRDYIKIAADHAKTLGSLLETIGKAAADAGGVFSFIGNLVKAIVKFPKDCMQAHRNSKNIDRMRQQKEQAKQMIYAGQKDVNGPKYVRKTRDNELEFDHNHKDFDHMRIDERIQSLEASVTGKGRALYLRGLKEYALTKELTGANQKRRRETVYTILVDELGGILSSATTLFGNPALGGILSAVFSTIGGAKTLFSYAKKGLRNIHFRFADDLKTGDQKWAKRHQMAIWTFKNLALLGEHEAAMTRISPDTTNPMQVRSVRDYLPVRLEQKNRVKAMQVDMDDLGEAKDAVEILDILRSGFYRDAEENQGQTK